MANDPRENPRDEFAHAPKAPLKSPQPDVVPEAAPPGQTQDPTAGLQPIDNSNAPLGGTRERAEAEEEAALREVDR